MSHESHTESGAGRVHTKVSFSSSFWLVIILVGLFISALNFIQAQKGGEGHEGHGATKEHAGSEGHGDAKHEEHGAATEAGSHGTEAAKPEAEHHDETKPEAKGEHAPEHK
jgi:hypothetical protein